MGDPVRGARGVGVGWAQGRTLEGYNKDRAGQWAGVRAQKCGSLRRWRQIQAWNPKGRGVEFGSIW